MTTPANLAASVHARLLNRAKAEGRVFNELLQYYAMERLLFRLSRSRHAERFVLKGALMFQLWGGTLTRATKDIDLLGRPSGTVDDLLDVFRDILETPAPPDGLIFDPATLQGDEIRLAAHYNGVRVRCLARLGNARLSLQVDIGFGDVVTPAAQPLEYPTLLDFAAPRLLGTTPETAIAEKLHAMVVLDMANTRMKDFFDVWTLSTTRRFSGPLVAQAVGATFGRRRTPLPSSTPIALTPTFHTDATKQLQWRAYLRKSRIPDCPLDLSPVVERIASFALPAFASLVHQSEFAQDWPPRGPWCDAR